MPQGAASEADMRMPRGCARGAAMLPLFLPHTHYQDTPLTIRFYSHAAATIISPLRYADDLIACFFAITPIFQRRHRRWIFSP